jgi:glycosyltransferase 2 family protein
VVIGGFRTTLLWLSGLAVGALFLWLALRAIDLRAVFAIMLKADLREVLGVVACACAFAGAKALRWSWLMQHRCPMPPGRLIGPVFAGTTVNYGVPHAGELVRSWMVARREGIPNATVLASIAVERLFDFCAALMLGLAALVAGRAAFDTLGAYLWALVALIAVALAIALPFVLRPEAAIGVSRSLLGPLPEGARDWFLRHLEHGIEGLGALQRGSTLAKVLALSIVQWASMAGCAWFSLRAVGTIPDPALALVVLLLLVVGLTLPAAPGHVGTTQVAFLLAATPYGIGAEEAIAGSFVYNVFVPLTFVIVGTGVLLHGRAKPA